MSFASDDADRMMFADAVVEVRGLREIHGLRRAKLLRFVRDATYKQLNSGVRDEGEVVDLVLQETEEEYGGVIATAIIIAIVSFIVTKILRRIWPD